MRRALLPALALLTCAPCGCEEGGEAEVGSADLYNTDDDRSDSVAGKAIDYEWGRLIPLEGNEFRGSTEVIEVSDSRVRVRSDLIVVRPGPRGYFEAWVEPAGLVSGVTTDFAFLLWRRPRGSTSNQSWVLFQVDAPTTTLDGSAGTVRASYFFRVSVDGLTGEVVVSSTGSFEDGQRLVLRDLPGADLEWGLLPFPASSWGGLDGSYRYVLGARCTFGPCTATGEYTLNVPVDLDGAYVVTAVEDDLWDGDMDVMGNGLSRLGYGRAAYNADVSAASLSGYLGRADLTTVYFTGHGFPGGVSTSGGHFTRETTTLRVENTIFASCRTLAEPWEAAMGSESQTVLGYTEPTYDFLDSFVARFFISEMRSGRSYVQAWYLANTSTPSNDEIWAAYVREPQGIVEYSARSGSRPVLDLPTAEVEIASGLHVAEPLLADERTFDDLFADVQAATDEPLVTDMAPSAFDLLAPIELSPEQAVVEAEWWLEARRELPADAVVDRVIRIQARPAGEVAGDTVGYVVRYRRHVAGLPIRGNLVEDHLSLLVTSEGVAATTRYWPETVAGEAGAWCGQLLSVGEALRISAESVSAALKGGEIHLVEARPVYGTLGPDAPSGSLFAAFELSGPDGSFVVDALTGDPVGLTPP